MQTKDSVFKKYAVISDVHGNEPAPAAVLQDAKAQGVTDFLLIGDYIEDLPMPNEVVETMQQLPNAVIIGGNKEGYLRRMQNENPFAWTYAQMAPMYWNYRALTAAHRQYLAALPKGVYFFGHNHLQWHMAIADKVFINPGSCGMPLDGDIRAPYTLLTQHPEVGGLSSRTEQAVRHTNPYEHAMSDDASIPLGWSVEERRVSYDTEAAIQALLSSALYAQAPVWSRLIIKQLQTGAEYISFFLRHANTLAQKRGCTMRPVPNTIWQEAAATFDYTLNGCQ